MYIYLNVSYISYKLCIYFNFAKFNVKVLQPHLIVTIVVYHVYSYIINIIVLQYMENKYIQLVICLNVLNCNYAYICRKK